VAFPSGGVALFVEVGQCHPKGHTENSPDRRIRLRQKLHIVGGGDGLGEGGGRPFGGRDAKGVIEGDSVFEAEGWKGWLAPLRQERRFLGGCSCIPKDHRIRYFPKDRCRDFPAMYPTRLWVIYHDDAAVERFLSREKAYKAGPIAVDVLAFLYFFGGAGFAGDGVEGRGDALRGTFCYHGLHHLPEEESGFGA